MIIPNVCIHQYVLRKATKHLEVETEKSFVVLSYVEGGFCKGSIPRRRISSKCFKVSEVIMTLFRPEILTYEFGVTTELSNMTSMSMRTACCFAFSVNL
jgi:hypothetical protein